MIYDLIIVGGGPAGIAAGIYAARKKIKTLLITDSFGGQSITSADVQNFIGIKSISGWELAKKLEEHLRNFEGESIEILDFDKVSKIKKKNGNFLVFTESVKSFESKTILMACGSRRRKLGVPGEKEFDGKGVAYCSTCDAPIFKNKIVAVVGGGNAGLESVIDLSPYAKEIYLLEYAEEVKGDPITIEKIAENPKVKIITMVEVLEVLGKDSVTGIKYKDRKNNEIKELPLEGIFIEIGWVPNSGIINGLVSLNKKNEIIVDHKTQVSSLPGIWAAGDIADVLYKQNNISMGDAIKAVLNIYDYLKKKKD